MSSEQTAGTYVTYVCMDPGKSKSKGNGLGNGTGNGNGIGLARIRMEMRKSARELCAGNVYLSQLKLVICQLISSVNNKTKTG